MRTEKQLIRYVTKGSEAPNDTLCLAEFEAEMTENLAIIGTGQATAFLRFNKKQPAGVVYNIVVERIE